jgi:hypothetical protein
MSSGTVAAGDAISENPAAGTVVSAGSAVNLVVSSGPAGPPAVVSVSPSSGTGLTQTFTAVYSDPKGAADLSSVRMLFNTSLSGGSGCYLIYYPGSNAFYLENNADSATVGPLAPGSSATISNSQCTLAGTGTSVSTSGNNMTVKFALTFSSTFDGSEKVYMGANSASAASGWVQEGTWTP